MTTGSSPMRSCWEGLGRALSWALLGVGLFTPPVAGAVYAQDDVRVAAPRAPGWLGLNLEIRSEFERDRLLSSELRIIEVHPASGAAMAGVRAGDILLRIGSADADERSLSEAIGQLKFGDRVPLTIQRNGQVFTFEVEASLRPDAPRALAEEESRFVVFTPPASRQATWSALRRAGSEVERAREERRLRVSTPEGQAVQIIVMADPEGRASWSYVTSESGEQRQFFVYNPDVEALVNGIDVLRLEIEDLSRSSNRRAAPAIWRWLRGDRRARFAEDANETIAEAEARIRELEGELARTALRRIGPTPDTVLTLAVGSTRPITPYAYLGRRYLAGAYLAPMNEGMREYFGVSSGALVLDAVEGAPALEAGLRPGDVILAVDGTGIEDPDALQVALSQSRPPYSLTVMRRGQRMVLRLP